jgi:hypothetical protein
MGYRPVRIAGQPKLLSHEEKLLTSSSIGASGSASDRRHAIAEFAHNYPRDPVDLIIADFMSEANMVTGAVRRVNQGKVQNKDPSVSGSATANAPGYELSFLLALQPALEDLARYGIKVAVNAGNTDTEGLYEVVMEMVKAKGLSLKVGQLLRPSNRLTR